MNSCRMKPVLQVKLPFDARKDGSFLNVDMVVTDIFGNVVSERVTVGADSSPPKVTTTPQFKTNTNKPVDGIPHFTSRY